VAASFGCNPWVSDVERRVAVSCGVRTAWLAVTVCYENKCQKQAILGNAAFRGKLETRVLQMDGIEQFGMGSKGSSGLKIPESFVG
jgi:hypothetical protein